MSPAFAHPLPVVTHFLNHTVPSSVGTFYHYACVDAVSGESDTQNNCSEASVLTTRERSQ